MGNWEIEIKIFSNIRVDMPLKSYRKKPRGLKRKYIKRRGIRKGGIVKLINKVMLKKVETKNTHWIEENNNLYHNGEYIVASCLQTQQGINDTQTGLTSYTMRIGDSVVARGLSIKIWLANKDDRPNVMYRLTVFRYGNPLSSPASVYASQSGANVMIRDYNTEKIRVLRSKVVNCNNGFNAFASGSSTLYKREGHKLVKFWIPLKNQVIKYSGDNNAIPAFSDIGFSISAYDSYGTLTTDNIASFAYNYKFYFKDP